MKKLIDLRKSKKRTQSEVAKILSISQVAYSKYETGKAEPSHDILLKLADYYNVSIDYLLDRENKETAKPVTYERIAAALKRYDIKDRELTEEQVELVATMVKNFINAKKQ